MPLYDFSLSLDITAAQFGPFADALNHLSGDWYAVAEPDGVRTYQCFESSRDSWTEARESIQARLKPVLQKLTRGDASCTIRRVTQPEQWHTSMCRGTREDGPTVVQTGCSTPAGVHYDNDFFATNHKRYWQQPVY